MAAKRKTRNPKSPSTNRSSQQTLKQASETGELETFEEFVIGSDIVEMEGEAMATSPLGRLRSMYAQEERNIIAEWEARIESHEEAKRVLEKLTTELRTKLVTLVLESFQHLERHRQHVEYRKRITKLAKQAPSQYSNLARKVSNACAALQNLIDHASALDPLISAHTKRVAESCMQSLQTVRAQRPANYWRTHRDDLVDFYGSAESPCTEQMVRLYQFFHHDCRLSGDESEIRVAVIRNAFWVEYGVTQVVYYPRNTDLNPKGCTAVRQSVARLNPAKSG